VGRRLITGVQRDATESESHLEIIAVGINGSHSEHYYNMAIAIKKKQWIWGMLVIAVLVAWALSYALARPDVKLPTGSTTGISWLEDYDEALAEARLADKLVLIDFYADWCPPCQEMERTTFADAAVLQRMADFVPLKIDFDQHQELVARYGVTGLPTTLVVDADGQPVIGAVGYLDAKDYLSLLADAASKAAQPQYGILGQTAPSLGVETWFNLPAGKQSIDVSDYRGKVIYLYGFQSWCPGCKRYGFPTLKQLIEHYQDNRDVAFIAVQTTFEGFDTNTPKAAKETADRYGLSIPVGHSGASDQPSQVMRRYRSGGTPWTVIIDREGTVRFNDFHIKPEAAVKLMDRLLVDNDL
jgi:thiol-disulfide isomerase/thioredoxin